MRGAPGAACSPACVLPTREPSHALLQHPAAHPAGVLDAVKRGYLETCTFGFSADKDAKQLLEQVSPPQRA